jgi:hypothetical protein
MNKVYLLTGATLSNVFKIITRNNFIGGWIE